MACTVAVEESIAHHYNNQIRTLMEDPEKYEELLQVFDSAPGRGWERGKGRMRSWVRRKTEC